MGDAACLTRYNPFRFGKMCVPEKGKQHAGAGAVSACAASSMKFDPKLQITGTASGHVSGRATNERGYILQDLFLSLYFGSAWPGWQTNLRLVHVNFRNLR